MGRAIIAIANLAMLLLVFGIMIVGGGLGRLYAGLLFGANSADAGTLVGAIAGFLIAVVLTSYFFVLSEIEKNTRRIANAIERGGGAVRN